MTEQVQTERPKRTLSEEQKAKMAEGRRRKAEERRRAQQLESSAPEEPAPLVRTSSAEIRERQQQQRPSNGNGASLEDIAQRHVARDAGLVDEAADEEEEESATSFHGADDAVPAEEVDPERRDRPSAFVPRDDGDGEIQYIPDIMAEWGEAIDMGTCFIRVERLKPTTFEDLSIKGAQRPITQSLTENEFLEIYGGGTYDLVVYGPKKHGHRLDSRGRVRHQRLSKPIRVIFSLNYPPNIDAVVQEDELDMESMPYQGYRQGIRRTNADASIHKSDLEFKERDRERQREEHRERLNDERQRTQKLEREHNAALAELSRSSEAALRMMKETHGMQLQMMQKQIENLENRIKEERTSTQNRPTESQLAIDLAKTSMQTRAADPEQLSRMEAQYSKAREDLIRQHNEETKRLRDEHRQELERLQRQMDDDRRRAEERVEHVRKEVDNRIAEVQRQADARVAEAEKRAERDVKHAKDGADQRVHDIENSYRTRIEDIERGHKRDLQSKEDSFTMRRESLENTHSTQLAAKDAELTRVKEENTRLRAEAEKPLGQRMAEFDETAEHMGYKKGDGDPQDWKTTLAQTGMEVFGQLPQIVQSVSAALQTRRSNAAGMLPPQGAAPQQLPPPVQGRGGGIAAARSASAWATSDGPDIDLGSEPDFDVELPGEPPGGPTRHPVFQGDSPNLAPPPPQAAPPPPPPPAPAQIVPQRQQATPNPSSNEEIADEDILRYSTGLTAAVDQGASAQDYYDMMRQQFGPEMVEAITSQIDPERITRVLQEHDSTNSLLRRDGQKFLHEIWTIARSQNS